MRPFFVLVTGTKLAQRQNEKSPAIASEAFRIMVPRGGIEPPTRGFSISYEMTVSY